MSTRSDGGTGSAGPAAPGSGEASVVLPAAIRDALVAHAVAEVPNEMCGFIVGTGAAAGGGTPLRWEPARNAAASPLRFDVAAEDLVRITLSADDRGEAIWAVVHSHVRSAAVPSAADVAGAVHPEALQVIVSLAATGESDREAVGRGEAGAAGHGTPAAGGPSVRAWRIAGGAAAEVALEVVREPRP